MDQETGEQINVAAEHIGDDKRFSSTGSRSRSCCSTATPSASKLPAHVVIQITSSEPGIKGDTASGATKPATLSTGATINVPLFINEGEWIKVDTRDGSYLERVNRR